MPTERESARAEERVAVDELHAARREYDVALDARRDMYVLRRLDQAVARCETRLQRAQARVARAHRAPTATTPTTERP